MFYDENREPRAVSTQETVSSWIFAFSLVTAIMLVKGIVC